MNPAKYMGIADCHGLESLSPIDPLGIMSYNMLAIRAASNPQRYAVPYKANISKETYEMILGLMKNNSLKYRFEDALILLKTEATSIYVPEGYEILWDSIPNRKIDPYYSPDE